VGLLADGRLVALDDPDALVAEHGGASLLVVEGTFDEATPERIDYPAEMSLRNGSLLVAGVRPEAIAGVVDALEDAGVAYDSLTWRQPDLEDVYLELTGTAVGQRGEPHQDELPAGGLA
jgi:ABC-2 type transport system ATP-binding protein